MQGAQSPSSKTRGVGRYTVEMVKAFLAIVSNKHEIFLVLNGAFEEEVGFIRSEFSNLLPRENIKCWQQYLTPVSGISNNLWNRKVSELVREWYMTQLKPDIIWSTNLQEGWHDDAVTSVKDFEKDVLYFTTLHDVIPLIFREKYLATDIKYWYEEKINYTKKSDIILTVSNYSREKITELLGVDGGKVFVAGNSFKKEIFNINDKDNHNLKLKLLLPEKYILYAGGVDEHKNILRLISAYALLDNGIKSKYKLIFAGKDLKAREAELLKYWSSLGLKLENLIFTGYVSDAELAYLYRNTALFVFPSYSEGFGIPPLEAMACGCPVIAANAASIPEIIGLPEALFDPHNENDIAEKIQSGLINDDYRKKLITNGIARTKIFSWETSAKVILNLLEMKIITSLAHHKSTGFNSYHDLIKQIATVPRTENNNLLLLSQSIADSFIPEDGRRKVYLDLSCLVHFDHATGIQRVSRAITTELERMYIPGVEFVVIFSYVGHKHFYLAEKSDDKYFTPKESDLHNNIVDFNDGDILLFLDLHPGNVISKKYEIAKLRNRGIKIYSIVYDLLPISYPKYFVKQLSEEFKEWLCSVTHLDGAFCISKDVAEKFSEWISDSQIIPDRFFEIKYFHLGADLQNSSPSKGIPNNAEKLLTKFSRNPSFLMVGTVEPRKGHAFVLDAFERLWKSKIDVILIIVGRQGWCNEATANRIRKHKEYNNRLFWLEGISDEYLEKIYAVSTCLIAASEGEGFGLPLIEAAQHKLPIIARDIPVFREVAGEHAHYFSGVKPKDLSDTINDWLKLNAKGMVPQSKNMPWLTWRQSTQQLLKLLFPEVNYDGFQGMARTDTFIENNINNNKFYFKKLIRRVKNLILYGRTRQYLKKIYYVLGLNKVKF